MPVSTSIRDIASTLNLSNSTVSKALNGYADVSAATRDLVMQTALELGYQPSASARNLRRGQTDKIGLFLNTAVEYAVDYLSGILPGAVQTAQGFNKNLIIYTFIDNDPGHLLSVCRTGEIDGVALFSTHYDSATMETLLKERFPFVVIGREIRDPRVSYVVPDYYAGSYQATRYLIEIGHRRIAFTTRPELTTANEAHLQGHRDAMRDARIAFDESFLIETHLEPRSGTKAAGQLLELPQLPTAIRAFHDLVALEMIEVFQQCGWRVPEDVSVIGFDGLNAGFKTIPHITTVAQPLARIGKRVMEIINQQIEGSDSAPIQEVVPVELILRGSTIPLCVSATIQHRG